MSADCLPAWNQIGPSPLKINPVDSTNGTGPDAGLVRDIAIDPSGSSDQIIFLATDSGGVWKTTDGGSTWSPKTDFMPSLNMGSVALDPANSSIVYAGTGNELNQNISKGAGLYKSTDAGANWTVLGANIFLNVAINRIVLAANNVLLIASGNGVYRSVDGGAHFGNNSPQFDNNIAIRGGDVTDLDVDSASNSTVYASISGSGIFKSTDSGATFPASGNLFTSTNGSPSGYSYIAFAQSTQPNNQTMYVNLALLTPGAGLYKSADAGATWSRITTNTNDLETIQKGYAQTVGVDPQDATRAYFGGRALYMVTDGGTAGLTAANRIDLNKVHADQHALVFTPPSHRTGPSPTRFYTGTDGGLASTSNGGSNWTLLNGSANCTGPNTALATLLFRQIDIGRGSTANNAYTYGAAQDLGISAHTPDCPATPWHLGGPVGGDGWWVTVDPATGVNAIAQTGGGFFGTADATNWQGTGTGLLTYLLPMLWDPTGGNNVYSLQSNQLFRSTDRGANFASIKTFTGASLTVINMVRTDSKTIWVGATDGAVWHTNNADLGATASWTRNVVAGAPSQGISGISIDPSNTSQAVVIYPGGRVFRTTNNGANWNEITGPLQVVSLNDVVIDPNTSPPAVIVASDAGVVRTLNLGLTWENVGVGLPNVFCTSLALDSTAFPSLLRVGTYGRSAFELAYDRKYVDSQNSGLQDGTREHPYQTVRQAVNASGIGAIRSFNIQTATYQESPITINQCVIINARNGVVTIR